MTLAAGGVVLAASLYGATFLKQVFMPNVDQGSVNMAIVLPPGAGLSETDQVAFDIEQRLLGNDGVEAIG